MKKYAISMYCSRTEKPGNPNGRRPGSITIHHSPGVVRANSRMEAEGIGLAIMRKLLPATDGWIGYDVKVNGIDRILTIDGAELVEAGSGGTR